jgi:hypothetical protein
VSRVERELDALIEEITVDCYGGDEQLGAFENAFQQDATLPCPGSVVGERVEVRRVAAVENRGELVAICERAGRCYDVALLDVDLQGDEATVRLDAAYRRWIGSGPAAGER